MGSLLANLFLSFLVRDDVASRRLCYFGIQNYLQGVFLCDSKRVG